MLKFGSANHRQNKINKAKVHSFPKRESFIIFIHFSSVRERERESVRDWERVREKNERPWGREHRSSRVGSERSDLKRRWRRRRRGGASDDGRRGERAIQWTLRSPSVARSERSDLKRRRHWKEPVALSLGLDWILVISFFFDTLVISEIRRWNEIL